MTSQARMPAGTAQPPPRAPLSGLRIVEAVAAEAPAALALAAGLCGRIAADLGAAVIRLEPADLGDAGGFLAPGKQARSRPRDVAGWQDVLGDADAVLLDSGSFDALSPAIGDVVPVLLAMSRDAPSSGTEFTVEARSGLLDLIGDPACEPLRLGGHQMAYSAGLAAYLGMIAAILRRRGGLPAGPVRVCVLDVAVWLNWKSLSLVARTGRSPSRPGALGEWSVVRCADGHAALVYRNQEWAKLRAALGDPRLADERFQTPQGRRRHRAELNAILAECFAPMTRAEIRALSLAAKLPLGPVWTPDELRRDPHMIARAIFGDGSRSQPPRLPVAWRRGARTYELAGAAE